MASSESTLESSLGEKVKRPGLVSAGFKMTVNISAELLKDHTFIKIFLDPIYF